MNIWMFHPYKTIRGIFHPNYTNAVIIMMGNLLSKTDGDRAAIKCFAPFPFSFVIIMEAFRAPS